MSDWDGDRRGGRATTWDAAERRRRALARGGALADFREVIAKHLRNWAIADTGPGRLLPWLPIAFGLGIAIYFGAEREPAWWAAVSLALVCATIVILARRRPVAFPLALAGALEPLRPGGCDFARDLYFQGIGATGFALGAIRIAEPPVQPGLWLRYATTVQGIRDAIDARIRAALPGDKGAIASALITGKRDAISAQVNDAMYISSLAHVLSISGYHMALVAGVVFFALRALLALSPSLASGRPIKKWAAAGALVAAAAYLVLSTLPVLLPVPLRYHLRARA